MKKVNKTQKQKRRVDEFPTFNFNYEKVKEYCKSLKDVKERLRYLNYVLKEKKNSDGIDIELHFPGPSFVDKIKNEIKYYEKELKLIDPYMADGYHKIIWLQKQQDFAFLFHRLIERNFIKLDKEKYIMLCNHFKWKDGDMEPEQLKQAINNIKNRPETHKLSNDIKTLTIIEDE